LYNLEVKRIQAEFSMKAAFAQNAFKFASDKYSATAKAFSEQREDSKKYKFKKPYSPNLIDFPLDSRML